MIADDKDDSDDDNDTYEYDVLNNDDNNKDDNNDIANVIGDEDPRPYHYMMMLTRPYTYCDTEGDEELATWALPEDDTQLKIPYMKMAKEVKRGFWQSDTCLSSNFKVWLV